MGGERVLEGKTVVVCGVGPGLGGEVARLAVRDGANVMIAARRGDKLEAFAAELDPSGERVGWQATDITDADQCMALAEATVKRFGRIDALAPGRPASLAPDMLRRALDFAAAAAAITCSRRGADLPRLGEVEALSRGDAS